MSYAKFKIAVISRAEYDNENVGYSTVQADFPLILGPLAVFDQVDILMKPWGRDPAGNPLFVNETAVDRWTAQIVQEGIASSTAFATPIDGTLPAACLLLCNVSSVSAIAAIDNAVKHFVLGVFDPDLNGDPVPPALQPYAVDVEMPAARWTELRNGLIALGINADQIDAWRANNQNATPRVVGNAFKNLITTQNEAQL